MSISARGMSTLGFCVVRLRFSQLCCSPVAILVVHPECIRPAKGHRRLDRFHRDSGQFCRIQCRQCVNLGLLLPPRSHPSVFALFGILDAQRLFKGFLFRNELVASALGDFCGLGLQVDYDVALRLGATD
jgi:hypothetical protein